MTSNQESIKHTFFYNQTMNFLHSRLVKISSTEHSYPMHYSTEIIFLHRNKLTIRNLSLQYSMLNLIIHCSRDAKTNIVNNHTGQYFTCSHL